MSNSPYQEFKAFIEKAFPLGIPEQLSVIDEALFKKAMGLFQSQEGLNFYQLNYAELIEGYLSVFAPIVKEYYENKSEFTTSEINEFRNDNRRLIALIYLKEVQSTYTSPWRKVEVCHFIIMFLTTAKEIYNTDFIDNQADFLSKVGNTKNHIENNLRLAETIAISSFNLWPHGNEALNKIQLLLQTHGFIGETDNLLPIFTQTNAQRIDWKGKTAALMYLLFLSNHRKNDIGNMSLSDFAAKSFTINGKISNSSKLSKSLSAAKSRFAYSKPEYVVTIEKIATEVLGTV